MGCSSDGVRREAAVQEGLQATWGLEYTRQSAYGVEPSNGKATSHSKDMTPFLRVSYKGSSHREDARINISPFCRIRSKTNRTEAAALTSCTKYLALYSMIKNDAMRKKITEPQKQRPTKGKR